MKVLDRYTINVGRYLTLINTEIDYSDSIIPIWDDPGNCLFR